MLELAILGLLLESPMHGYELRKRLTGLLGAFRAFSYGSLYPTLRRMQADGLIAEEVGPQGTLKRRARRVYRLTTDGRQRFTELVADTGPQNYTDDGFGVHLAFFSRTPAVARMRILEGRRRQVEERREGLREAVGRSNRAVDRYTRQLHQLSLESSEREVRWLNELIAAETSGVGPEGVADLPGDPGAGFDMADGIDAAPATTTAEPATTGTARPVTPKVEGEPDHG
ncbi:PadR family transcriptional regulator [Williamsia sterculiae]|uniref:DNA-binding transcriptional regulator, PadR family n=1 Tax=Williamsia sterculiae TaxID=1344003 RepID=A0A1N7FHV7_9NOCA|nr:PadR family transcriptional regulator [Williamsia sterculiae]SIS00008.1 DNA-binding transcriptional regulator, PadR family [Williamsia sterculiae]